MKTLCLRPSEAVFPPTSVTKVSRITIEIVNETDSTLRGEWRKYESSEIEREGFDVDDPEIRANLDSYLRFESDVFSIDPPSSKIWPRQSAQIVVSFAPQAAGEVIETAYFYEPETGVRVPFVMRGAGMPGDARFNVQQINVGHIMLDSICEYQVMLKNTGEIPVDFRLRERDKKRNVTFTPSEGTVEVGSSVPVLVEFVADRVGQFNDSFTFDIDDVVDCPSIALCGRVLGPSCSVSRGTLSFGEVSFGFLYSETFEIQNQSDIPYDFHLSFISDGSFEGREFNVLPGSGTVPKHGVQKVTVEFIPIAIREYRVKLRLDGPEGSEQNHIILIRATCICPEVSLLHNEIDLGELFIGHTYEAHVGFTNSTDYPGKFEFLESLDESSLEARLDFVKPRGVVGAKKTVQVPVMITPTQLGHISLTRYVRVYGSDKPPLCYTLKALSVGPRISLSTKEVNFDQIDVLQDVEQDLIVSNNSLISAPFKCSFSDGCSVFRVEPSQGEIGPNESCLLKVKANLDDSIMFQNALTLIVANLSPIVVSVKAKGKGKTVVADIDMNKIDFGFVFTGQPATKRFKMENCGRRQQEIKWTYTKPKNDETPDGVSVEVQPETVVLKHGQVCEFEMILQSNKPTTFSVFPQCTYSFNRQRSELYKPEVVGTFINPIFVLNDSKLCFQYIHNVSQEENINEMAPRNNMIGPSKQLLRPITLSSGLKNTTALPLSIETVCPQNFSIAPSTFTVEPGNEQYFDVTFDPSYKTSFGSESVDGKIFFKFKDSQVKYAMNVHADLIFPNLSFSPGTSFDFGILLLNTEGTQNITLTNTSQIRADFVWELLTSQDQDMRKIFDISPIRGSIAPGNSEDVHVTFFAMDGEKVNGSCNFKATAVCHVIGGPDYTINLSGSSALIQYDVSPRNIDFGKCDYMSMLKSEIALKNKSEVPVKYQAKVPTNCCFRDLTILPASGVANAGETVNFTISAVVGAPRLAKTTCFIQIGQFDDVEIDLCADSYAPQLTVDIPRAADDPTTNFVMQNSTESEGIRKHAIDFLEEERKYMITHLQQRFKGTRALLRTQRKLNMIINYSGFVLSKFEIDLGTIVLGERKSLTYQLESVTPFPISFEILANSLKGTGFSINPSSFKDIPLGAKLGVEVVFETHKKKKGGLGDVEYSVPLVFKEDLAYMLVLKAHLETPNLVFSQTQFEFETTVIGQSRIQTLQLQNITGVPCEFTIDPAVPANRVQKSISGVFTATPSCGVLPPSSFQNIEIEFRPPTDKNFVMQFPINIKHNKDTFSIGLKGSGAQMKLVFDPPQLTFPALKSFSDPIQATVDMINPTEYPIDVFSRQYDFNIYCQELRRQFEANQPSSLEEPIVMSNAKNTISKFSVCVIVHGPMKSGRTTISNEIAKYMGGVPALSLKELWDPIGSDASPMDYVTVLKEAITESKYDGGFVVDGLDVFPEGNDSEAFLVHFMKQKGTPEELQKNPFTCLQHDKLTACEKALTYVLASLNGHYVFQVALNANEPVLQQRKAIIDNEEKEKRIAEHKKEMDSLFNMTEDEYNALTEEEQQVIDRKREYLRSYLITHQGDPLDLNPDDRSSTRRRGRTTARKTTRGRAAAPSDPLLFSVMLFQYTFGCISQMLREKSSTFQVIDPTTLCSKVEEPEGQLKSISQDNTLLVDATIPVDDITREIYQFLPQVKILKEKAFTLFIPSSRVVVPPMVEELETMPTYFRIVNDEPAGEFPKPTPPPIPSRRESRRRMSTTRSRKDLEGDLGKTTDSVMSTISVVIPDEEKVDPILLTKRWHLEPGQRATINVEFSCSNVGEYKDKLLFGICNAKNEVFSLPLRGICEHPDIDRNLTTMFSTCVEKPAPRLAFTFVTETNEFVFGSLLSKGTGKKDASSPYRQEVRLVNVSPFACEVSAFLTKQVKGIWALENASMTIPPKQTGLLGILFNPTSQDQFRNSVSIQIKDNPDPLEFNVFGEGCNPAVDVVPNVIDFEKLLLNQVRTMKVSLKNVSKVTAFWRVKGTQPGLEISPSEGLLYSGKSTSMSISFSSAKPVVLKKAIQIDVMDQNKTKTFSNQHVNVTAESFDVAFDFQFPKPMNHLKFGISKVSQEKSISCMLKNKGKYPTKFKAVVAKGPLQSILSVTPNEGTVAVGDKGLAITFTFCAPTPMKFSNAKGISLKIFDSVSDTQTAQIPIPFSAETVYSSYELSPLEELDFGAAALNTQVAKELTITNTGTFPFDFELVPKIEVSEPATGRGHGRSGRNKRVAASQAPRKQKRSNGKEIQVSYFGLALSAGSVPPGGSVAIPCSFNTNLAGDYVSTVFVKISDCEPSISNEGIPFRLKGKGLIPGIKTDDYEKIFPGQHLCLRYDIARLDMTGFLEDEQVLHFAPLVLKKTASVDVALINPLTIPCTVDLNVKPRVKQPNFPFSLSEKSVTIAPKSTSVVQLSFTPTVSGAYDGSFEAVVHGGTDPKTKALRFGIEGDGALPSITLVPQSDLTPTRNYVFNFGKTLVGFKKDKMITIINDGTIPAYLTIKADVSPDFILEGLDSDQEFSLAPSRQYNITACYSPKALSKCQFNIAITVRDNPAANMSVTFVGEGFSEDVIFEGLAGDDGDLVFKDNIVEQQQIATFTMRNVCDEDVRFAWTNLPDITFSPRVGQLRSGASKEITARFVSEKPVKYSGLKVSCQWMKIALEDPNAPDWDDTMKQVQFVQRNTLNPNVVVAPSEEKSAKNTSRKFPAAGRRPSAKKDASLPDNVERQVVFQSPKGPDFDLIKVTEIQPEPQYKVTSPSQKELTLNAFAVSDFIQYQLSVSEIAFAPTMMFETRVVTASITNTSTIKFEYRWDTTKFTSLRTDYYLTRPSPFSVTPSSGTIEPGKTTTFNVKFAPEEVDDFTSTLVCEIPHISKMDPPKIQVNGISRRPLCHFNLETTDYLTAGRRHPDYTDPLPDGVRVIELFAKSIGAKASKRFEIINTTEAPYEIIWTEKTPQPAITCETPRAMVSSGKRYVVTFSYTPTSVKTIESLWEFSIPEYGATASILVVGRIMPRQ